MHYFLYQQICGNLSLVSTYFDISSPIKIVMAATKPIASAVNRRATDLNSISLNNSPALSSVLGIVVLEILDRIPFRRSSEELK